MERAIKKAAAVTATRKRIRTSESYHGSPTMSMSKCQIGELLLRLCFEPSLDPQERQELHRQLREHFQAKNWERN